MLKTITYSKARAHLKECLDYTVKNNDPIVVTRKNGEDIVIMSKHDYDSIEETLYLLSSKNNREHLFSSIQNIRNGKKIEFNSIDDLDKYIDSI